MANAMKVTVIGGGSTYTPELVEGLLSGEAPVREIVLHDILADKLATVGGLARRMSAASAHPVPVTLTTDLGQALDGADVVVAQLRVGGLAARALDERIPLKYGVVGQETTGPGGFAKALRTVPVILNINQEMGARCPDALFITFTNPSGLVAEALRLHGRGCCVGLCNYALMLRMLAAKRLKVDESAIELAYFGLNHLTWTRILVHGVDRTPELLLDDIPRELTGYAFDPALLQRLGLLPIGYLRYYYDTEGVVEELRAMPETRAERLLKIEAELLTQYADPALHVKPEGLQVRGGAWYSTAALRVIRDLRRAEAQVHVLNVRNDGAVPFLPNEVVVETPALVGNGAIRSLPTVQASADGYSVAGHPIPADVITLIQRVKAFELMTIEAALSGDWATARRALEIHPLLEQHASVIPALLDELLTAHRAYLPRFFPAA